MATVAGPESEASRPTGSANPRLGLLAGLRIFIFFALATATVEVLSRPHLPIGFGSYTRYPARFAWVAPLSVLAGCLVLWLLAVLIALPIRPLGRRRALWTLAAFPFTATLVEVGSIAYRRLDRVPELILALGLATLVMRTLIILAGRLRILPSLGWGLALLMLVGLGVRAITVEQALRIGPPPRSATPGARNVVLITLDTLRAANMGLYGYERPTTPELEKLAAESLVYDRAYSTTSWTLPSHASMFTGLWSHPTRASWTTAMRSDVPTLAEILRGRGYDTAGFVANLAYCTRRSGLARGFARYEDHVLDLETILLTTAVGRSLDHLVRLATGASPPDYPGRKDAETVRADFLDWLDEREGGRPFFAFINFFDVHQPYETAEPWRSTYDHRRPGEDERAVIRLAAKASTTNLDYMDRYDGAIAYLDHQVGLLVAELRRRGLLDDTLLVITSDHGETFGEHRAEGHGASLYAETLHVPLLIRAPGVPAGLRLGTELSLRDLGRTILELVLDQATVAASGFPGTRFPLGEDDQTTSSPLFCQLDQGIRLGPEARNQNGAVLALVRDGLHLIVHRDGSKPDELYDLTRDPFERDDLAEDPAYAERLAALRAEFRAVSETAR